MSNHNIYIYIILQTNLINNALILMMLRIHFAENFWHTKCVQLTFKFDSTPKMTLLDLGHVLTLETNPNHVRQRLLKVKLKDRPSDFANA